MSGAEFAKDMTNQLAGDIDLLTVSLEVNYATSLKCRQGTIGDKQGALRQL